MRRFVMMSVLMLGCGSHEEPQRAAPSVPTECASVPTPLTAFDDIADGVPFSLEVRRDEHGAWLPIHPLHMPMHHASMINWADDAHVLEHVTTRDPVVFFATGRGAPNIDHDETRGVYFATYTARVDRVCPMAD